MLESFFTQTVSVETFTGPGPTGDTYEAPHDVVGLLDEGSVLQVNTPTGDVVESSSAFFCQLSEASRFTTESRVTLPSGAVMQVVRVFRRQASPVFAQVAHLEVRLK